MVPNCAEAGVLGVLCGIIGSIQATEVIKLIIGQGDSLLGRLLRLDALAMKFREHRLPRDPSCPLCGKHPSITRLTEIAVSCATDDITAEELAAMRGTGKDFVLVDVRTPEEAAVCEISGSVKLPLAELPTRLAELPKDRLIVLHCHSGVRSARALKLLQEQGYTRLKNLAGGIEAWRRRSGN
jgi:adenylyltransferase/sulfurtransferase